MENCVRSTEYTTTSSACSICQSTGERKSLYHEMSRESKPTPIPRFLWLFLMSIATEVVARRPATLEMGEGEEGVHLPWFFFFFALPVAVG